MRITLCGSTRFMEQFHAWNRWLALHGHSVYSVATSVKGDFQPTEEEKETLDLVHFDKIINSDTILVIDQPWNPEDVRSRDPETNAIPYIGESTSREIKWAVIQNKPIYHNRTKSYAFFAAR